MKGKLFSGIIFFMLFSCVKYPAPDKICALTFDDGPDNRQTTLVLDKLEKHGIVASFFVVGQRLNDSTAPIVKRMTEMGCTVENHSMSYADMVKDTNTYPDGKAIADSIVKTSELIVKYAGKAPEFFRVPNLSINKMVLDNINLPIAGGVLARDWDSRWGGDPTVQGRVDNVLNGVRDGVIILMHDVQPDPHPTPEALDIIIPELRKRGYEFVTIRELFVRKGVDPKSSENQNKMWVYVK